MMIEATDISKTYAGRRKRVRAVDMVSLRIEGATFFGLLGPNGAGKTTVLRILSTLIRADTGKVHVGGTDVATDPEGVRRLSSRMKQKVLLCLSILHDPEVILFQLKEGES